MGVIVCLQLGNYLYLDIISHCLKNCHTVKTHVINNWQYNYSNSLMVSQELIKSSKRILCLLSEEGIILCTVHDVFHMLVVQEKMNYTMIIVILITIEQILKTVIQKNYPFCQETIFVDLNLHTQVNRYKYTKQKQNVPWTWWKFIKFIFVINWFSHWFYYGKLLR